MNVPSRTPPDSRPEVDASVAERAPRIAACPRCQAAFECNATSGKACWCAALPALVAIDSESADCLCSSCLAHALAAQETR